MDQTPKTILPTETDHKLVKGLKLMQTGLVKQLIPWTMWFFDNMTKNYRWGQYVKEWLRFHTLAKHDIQTHDFSYI